MDNLYYGLLQIAAKKLQREKNICSMPAFYIKIALKNILKTLCVSALPLLSACNTSDPVRDCVPYSQEEAERAMKEYEDRKKTIDELIRSLLSARKKGDREEIFRIMQILYPLLQEQENLLTALKIREAIRKSCRSLLTKK